VTPETEPHEVVVVGGGLAGLTAARELAAAGRDAVVLEARDRVGGKTHSLRTEYGDVVELGGQWVGADQDRMLGLLSEFDIDTRPQYHEGEMVLRVCGTTTARESYREALRALPDESEAELFAAFDEIEADCERVPPDAPQTAPRAEEWDGVTLETWTASRFDTPEAKEAFDAIVRGVYTAEPADISYLFFLHYARTAGGFDVVDGRSEEKDSHESVVVEVQRVAEAMAAELGDRVRLDSRVRAVEQDDRGVRVRTDRSAYEADYAVVAVPPTLAGRIEYDPPLPAARDELTQRMPNGAVVKCLVRYESPFWRDAGYSGVALDDEGPANYFFDDGDGGDTGRLVGFVCGDQARAWADRSPAERRAAVTEQLVELYGDDRYADPVAYVDESWPTVPHSRGAYHGYPTPGTMADLWGALDEPVGRVHWAGAETATRWYGHMDGAVRSGERAASEVLERLG
jgi:monoamine oxidase